MASAIETDVLVIGAGPSGAAAARTLAAAGRQVLLVDRQGFPRDKICGDALIPDALQALGELGLRDRVLRAAHGVREVRIYAPDNRHASIAGECACLPRSTLDDLLRSAAIDAGAAFRPGLRAVEALESDGVVRGAALSGGPAGARIEVRARATILATGAASDAMQLFGVCLRSKPSATAARCYVRVGERTAAAYDHLCISYEASICPGYGWIFPGPGRIFNIGIGYVYDGPSPRERNVRTLLDRFLRVFPPAVALMKDAEIISPLRGAPLRTAMRGARFARPGLLVAGEAAGLTYSFTGEGIGKALQSGILAARAILDRGEASDAASAAMAAEYATSLAGAFGERFRAYARLQDWMAYPVVANLLIRRANAGRYVRAQLEALLNETGSADGLLSATGVIRALVT